jgi:hypothetical protein
MQRTARLHGVPLHSLPANSRALPSAEAPYFNSMPALRLLTLLRSKYVRCLAIHTFRLKSVLWDVWRLYTRVPWRRNGTCPGALHYIH